MKDEQNPAVALYATFSDEFVNKRLKDYKYPLDLLLKRDIMLGLVKRAYKNYYGIDANELSGGDFVKRKEYKGLYYSYASAVNSVIAAVGCNPLAVGKSPRPLTDDWKPSADLFHVNEYRQYEQSGFADDTLCYLWAQKEAYNKLHGITNPLENKFDNSFQKNHDSTIEQYSLHRYDFDGYAYCVAVTGKAEFTECDVEELLFN